MLYSVICYTLSDVLENSKSYPSGLPVSLFLEYFFFEDRGITPPRNIRNYSPVDTLKKIFQTTEYLTFQIHVFLLYDFFSFSSFFLSLTLSRL